MRHESKQFIAKIILQKDLIFKSVVQSNNQLINYKY